ncbi:MAG: 4Fe-4S binding protein [Haloferula sp.]
MTSRRDFFRSVFGRRSEVAEEEIAPESVAVPGGETAVDEVALILDRFCLAWQGSFCSVCVEQCPEPGAIVTDQGKPRVEPDLCTGCKVCQNVCPAPKNAIFTVATKPKTGMIGRWEENKVELPDPADCSSE